MADDHHQATSLIDALRSAGLKLAVNTDGDLDISGTPKALAVWHAMAAAIENLDQIVIAALAVPKDSSEALERWRRVGDGAEAFAERMSGGPPPSVTVPPPEQQHPRLPDPPFVPGGGYFIDSQGFAWRARRDLARAEGRPFTEPPPYRCSICAQDSNAYELLMSVVAAMRIAGGQVGRQIPSKESNSYVPKDALNKAVLAAIRRRREQTLGLAA
jgi:hypothetical protein